MPANTRKSSTGLRFKSGNLFLIKTASGVWEGLGNIISGKINLKAEEVSVKYADNNTASGEGSSSCGINIELAQVNKEVVDRVLEICGTEVKVYYNNGSNGSKTQEIFADKVIFKKEIDWEMKASTHQKITITGLINPADNGLCDCVPDTDLPEEATASGLTAIDSKNPYFVILET